MRYKMYACSRWKMRRLSITASKMALRPGVVKMMSAAAFAASVAPSTAMPIWACAKAGASLTPSPVMPTTIPMFCSTITTSFLSFGSTCANPSASKMSLSRVALAGHKVVLGKTLVPKWMRRLVSLAMFKWSPVIIFTSTCASRMRNTVSAVSSLGGSSMGTIPAKTMGPPLGSSRLPGRRTATAIVLYPAHANCTSTSFTTDPTALRF
mmetsp:Transcript_49728/g.98265  ORF Transcript_49728/g.98265 Transcript_49728/m.98265 type:complete len:209 (-) Transcript_49728:1363-1989(-)